MSDNFFDSEFIRTYFDNTTIQILTWISLVIYILYMLYTIYGDTEAHGYTNTSSKVLVYALRIIFGCIIVFSIIVIIGLQHRKRKLSKQHEEEENSYCNRNRDYCLHNGECIDDSIDNQRIPTCECDELNWTGPRCQTPTNNNITDIRCSEKTTHGEDLQLQENKLYCVVPDNYRDRNFNEIGKCIDGDTFNVNCPYKYINPPNNFEIGNTSGFYSNNDVFDINYLYSEYGCNRREGEIWCTSIDESEGKGGCIVRTLDRRDICNGITIPHNCIHRNMFWDDNYIGPDGKLGYCKWLCDSNKDEYYDRKEDRCVLYKGCNVEKREDCIPPPDGNGSRYCEFVNNTCIMNNTEHCRSLDRDGCQSGDALEHCTWTPDNLNPGSRQEEGVCEDKAPPPPPPPPPESWKCLEPHDGKSCKKLADNTGPYKTEEDCKKAAPVDCKKQVIEPPQEIMPLPEIVPVPAESTLAARQRRTQKSQENEGLPIAGKKGAESTLAARQRRTRMSRENEGLPIAGKKGAESTLTARQQRTQKSRENEGLPKAKKKSPKLKPKKKAQKLKPKNERIKYKDYNKKHGYVIGGLSPI